jgi:hypothetical protein
MHATHATAAKPAAPATSAASATSGASATEGELRTPPSSHRVFVDGHIVGNAGTPRKVACGMHVVRIGSSGRPQKIDVPCGDGVDVTPR